MFGYSYTIPPQGVDRRGTTVTRVWGKRQFPLDCSAYEVSGGY